MSPRLAEGKLRPIVGHQLPLAEAAEAHRLLLEPEKLRQSRARAVKR
jgi:NADPH:quinone reductase-like Zn-dependent oxidoreductase